MKVPNPPGSGKDIAEGKGVRREAESEGSWILGVERSPKGQPLARRTEIAYKAASEGEFAKQNKAQ